MEKLALAAFLHDIGKFRQRYELEAQNRAKDIKDYYKFFLEKNNFLPKNEIEELIKAVFEKEMPDDIQKAIVWVADKISISNLEENKLDLEEYDIKNIKKPLTHIFCDEKYFPIKKLSVKNIFPVDRVEGSYKELWDEFERDLNKINKIFANKENAEHLKINAFEYLFKKYTSLIPNRLDVSKSEPLYEHLRMSAMLAGVIGAMEEKEEFIEEIKKGNFEKKRFLLIAGDFFGIQDFIFDEVKTKYAAKTLRAKSAYIQILVKVLAFYIVEKLNLPYFSIISTHAGKFEILAPNEKRVIEILTKIKDEFNEFFLDNFFGETGVGIAYEECNVKELVNKKEYKLFRERLANKVEEIKFKKFDLHKIKEKIFKIDEGIDNQSLCDFCQKRKGESKEGYVICDVCKNFVDIGKNLVNNRFLAISKEKKDNDIEVFKGYYLHFFDNPSSVKLKDDVALYDIRTDEEFKGYEKWELSSYVATKNGEVLTLEELAALSVEEGIENNERTKGVEAIMALKGDADGMGDFIKTSKVTDSFSKFNFFAKMVDYYFSVYVPISFMQKEPFYTVFAGGDDLFVLGAWDKTIELAKNVRGDFKRFTENRLSFSTGLIMSKANKPVNFIAEFAEKALESAKDFCCKKTDKLCKEVKECKEGYIKKDAVSVFGYTLNWDFYNMVRKEVLEEFKKFEETYEVKTTILYRLLDLADMRIEMEKDIKKSIWKSKLCYFYRRNISEKDNDFLAFLNEKIENTPKEFKASLIEYIYKRRSK